MLQHHMSPITDPVGIGNLKEEYCQFRELDWLNSFWRILCARQWQLNKPLRISQVECIGLVSFDPLGTSKNHWFVIPANVGIHINQQPGHRLYRCDGLFEVPLCRLSYNISI